MRRQPRTYEETIEAEANQFAMCLLMPRTFVEREVTRIGRRGPLRNEDTEELARRFRVSQQAMLFRLDDLGYPLECA